eukprot:2937198-Pyramimonas_sp.AAC.1
MFEPPNRQTAWDIHTIWARMGKCPPPLAVPPCCARCAHMPRLPRHGEHRTPKKMRDLNVLTVDASVPEKV